MSDLISGSDVVPTADLTNSRILLWQRRRLHALVAIMQDHDCNTLNFNQSTEHFDEDPIARMSLLTSAARYADRLPHAAEVRGPSNQVMAAHGAARDRKIVIAVFTQFQFFTDYHKLQALKVKLGQVYDLAPARLSWRPSWRWGSVTSNDI